jgi:hypothetical protein
VKEYRGECETWVEENHEAVESVQNELLAYGGTKVSPQPQPNIGILAKCGMLVKSLPTTLRKGQPNSCYLNVMKMWETRGPRSTLVCHGLGYALSDDRMWRPHHWAFAFNKGQYRVVETTAPRRMYWGLPDGLGARDTHNIALLVNELFDVQAAASLTPAPSLQERKNHALQNHR